MVVLNSSTETSTSSSSVAGGEQSSAPQSAQAPARLLRVSCGKMVGARGERSGARLHKNMLVLHVLKDARTRPARLVNFKIGSLSAFNIAKR